MGTGPSLHSALNAAPGANVFRAWFFQQEATFKGGRDWKAFDHTLAVAKAHGKRVIATLADQWGACENGVYKNESWYQSGYISTVAVGTTQPYRDWVAAVVSRYRDNPTVLAWQLMNEAEDLTVFRGPCSSTANATLKSWTADMAAVVKSIDANHLLSLGTIGSGQCGGLDYAGLHSVSGIDLCEYHDYGAPDSPMPGDQWHGLQVQLNRCAALNKPLFVGESGIANVGPAQRRAAGFEAKLRAQFSAGVVGELIWDWRDGSLGGSSLTSYEVGPGDPVLKLFSSTSQ
jgi:endo-1,4-beta-mannosidase